MILLKKTLSYFRRDTINKLKNVTNEAQNATLKFLKKISDAKNKPRSKRKSLFLGFTTVIGIFGVTLVVPVLPAVAKDLPKKEIKPGEICPAPPPKPELVPSQQIINGLSGAAATICALAVSSGSFAIGGVCGIIVVIGILKAQGK